jgi:hypothetical protein
MFAKTGAVLQNLEPTGENTNLQVLNILNSLIITSLSLSRYKHIGIYAIFFKTTKSRWRGISVPQTEILYRIYITPIGDFYQPL